MLICVYLCPCRPECTFAFTRRNISRQDTSLCCSLTEMPPNLKDQRYRNTRGKKAIRAGQKALLDSADQSPAAFWVLRAK